MEFLLQPAVELTLEELELCNELMEEYRLPSLRRIYKPGVWYEQSCAYFRQYVWPKWDSSSVKNSRAQRLGKKAAEKKSKKDLKPQLSHPGNKDGDHRRQKRDLRGRFASLRKKDTDLG
jgi:hypothetical protein